MDIVQSMFDGVSYALSLNRSTLSGAIDIVVIKQADGTYKSTPFHARFGKLHLLYSSEKIVNIEINGKDVPISMKLGNAGEAFFVEATKEFSDSDPYLSTSPIITKRKSSVPTTAVLESAPVLIENSKIIDSPKIRGKDKDLINQEANQEDNRRKWKVSWMWGSLPRMQPNPELSSISTPSLDDPLRSSKSSREAMVSSATSIETSNSSSDNALFHSCSDVITPGPNSPLEIKKEREINYDDVPMNQINDEDEEVFFDFEEDNENENSSFPPASMPLTCSTFSPPHSEYEEGGIYISDWEQKKNEVGSPEAAKSLEESGFRTIYKPDSQPSDEQASSPTNQDFKSNSIESFGFLKYLNKDSLHSDSSIAISRCASQIFGPYTLPDAKKQQIFDKHIVTHAQLSEQPNILSKPEELVLRINSVIVPWDVGYPALMSALLFNKPIDKKALEKLGKAEDKRQNTTKAWMSWLYPNRWRQSSMPAPGTLPQFAVQPPTDLATPTNSNTSSSGSRISSLSVSSSNISLNQSLDSAADLIPFENGRSELSKSTPKNLGKSLLQQKEFFRKSLRPTSKQIELMGLQHGANSITFSVNTEFRGKQTLNATVYLWDWDSKLVISDIDGTITRSDIFGHVLPMLGKDWSHSGVAKLMSSIRENGYHIVYLTSRAIGQAQTTRNFINNLKQDGNTYLPKGPVFMSPDRLFCAFNREVILRKPEEFKIACLNDIKQLFPEGVNPFYAGYGNRKTDSMAYKAVGVPDGKIFIINPKGEITTTNKTYKKTYHNLHDLVHEMFPVTVEYKKGVSEDYNDWNYWKIPIPDLDDLN